MTAPTPTVDEIMAVTAVFNGFHDVPVEGGSVRVSTAILRLALENAYDSLMHCWPALVT